MKLNKSFILVAIMALLFNIALSLNISYQNKFLEIEKGFNNVSIYFYLSNESCIINIKPVNKSFNLKKCFGNLKLNNINKTLYVFFIFKNGTIIEKKVEKMTYYKILKRDIFISNEANLYINVSKQGYIKLCNEIIPLKKGYNKINLLPYLKKANCFPIGSKEITIRICEGDYCHVFKDYLNFEESPIKCKINVSNDFPYYVKFKFKVYSQKGIYVPKSIYFDMPLQPVKKGDTFIIYFPKFYKAGPFLIKFIVDGKTCSKYVNLSYEKFFYAYSSPFEKKINLTNLVLNNPYKGNYTITIEYLNKSLNVNLKDNKIIKLPFTTFKLKYKNETFFVVYPKIIKDNILNKVNEKIIKIVIFIFTLIFLFNLFVFLYPKKEKLKN